jgi:hypothetical protein
VWSIGIDQHPAIEKITHVTYRADLFLARRHHDVASSDRTGTSPHQRRSAPRHRWIVPEQALVGAHQNSPVL